jgi:hypothetical protein
MPLRQAIEDVRHRELTLEEEMATLTDDDVFDVVNLTSERTGIEGIVFVSTNFPQLRHGPRVKYFQKTGRAQPSFSVSISDSPQLVANSLPERVAKRLVPQVIEWVRLNERELLSLWREGDSWTADDLIACLERLKGLPADKGT